MFSPSRTPLARRRTPVQQSQTAREDSTTTATDSSNAWELLQKAKQHKVLYNKALMELSNFAQPGQGFWDGMGPENANMASILDNIKTDVDVDKLLKRITDGNTDSISSLCNDYKSVLESSLGDAFEVVHTIDSEEAFDRFFQAEGSEIVKGQVVKNAKEMAEQLVLPSKFAQEVQVIHTFANSFCVPPERSWTEHRLVACLKKYQQLPERYVEALGLQGYTVEGIARKVDNTERKCEEIRAVLVALHRLNFRQTEVCRQNMSIFFNRPSFFYDPDGFGRDGGMIYHNHKFKPECYYFLVAIYLGLEIPERFSQFRLLKESDQGFVFVQN